MTEIVTVDVGGTHARFALAEVTKTGDVVLGKSAILQTAQYGSFHEAWGKFRELAARPLPRAAAIAVAGQVVRDAARMTNNPWIIGKAQIGEQLELERYILINDFEAVAHAVAHASAEDFAHLAGPDIPLPATGTISVIGPGTGLGVAYVRRSDGCYQVQATEGGHIDFAPLDPIDDAILAQLRQRYSRVSVERVVAGPSLHSIYEALASLKDRSVVRYDDKDLWTLGTSREDEIAAAAIDHFCLMLGSVAGDLALAHGAEAVVIGGGLGLRIKDTLIRSGFSGRFCAKGRFQAHMEAMPVKLLTHPQSGLFGAAAAFAQQLPSFL